MATARHVKLVHIANAGQSSTNPETYELYLKGLFHAAKLTLDGLKFSIEYFDQALAERNLGIGGVISISYSQCGRRCGKGCRKFLEAVSQPLSQTMAK